MTVRALIDEILQSTLNMLLDGFNEHAAAFRIKIMNKCNITSFSVVVLTYIASINVCSLPDFFESVSHALL